MAANAIFTGFVRVCEAANTACIVVRPLVRLDGIQPNQRDPVIGQQIVAQVLCKSISRQKFLQVSAANRQEAEAADFDAGDGPAQRLGRASKHGGFEAGIVAQTNPPHHLLHVPTHRSLGRVLPSEHVDVIPVVDGVEVVETVSQDQHE
jgi:hypothetical protein